MKLEVKLEVVMMPGTSRGRPPPRGCGEKEQTLELSTLFYLMDEADCERRCQFYTKRGARRSSFGLPGWALGAEEEKRQLDVQPGFRTLLVLV